MAKFDNLDDENFDELGRPKKIKRHMSDWTVIKRIFKFVSKGHYRRILAVMLVSSIMRAVFGFFFPIVLRNIINQGLGGGIIINGQQPQIQPKYIYLNLKYLSIIMSVGMIFWFGQSYAIQTLGNRSMYRMRQELFEKLQKLSFDYYNAPNRSTGKIISYLTNDVETIQELIQSGILSVIGNLISLFSSLIMMFVISWKLSLVSFGIIPFVLIIAIVIFKNARRYFILMRRKIGAVTGHLNESVSGMRIIKAFSVEKRDYHKFDVLTDAELAVNLKAQKLFSLIPALIISVVGVGLSIVIAFGARLHLEQGLETGDILAFVLYLVGFMEPMIAVMQLFSLVQNSMSAGERILRVIDTDPSVQNKEDAYILPPIEKGRIEFSNVDFSYEEGQKIINYLNLKIKPKERIAIIGYTGAGKTTIINLINRFYDVDSGKIEIDGHDIRDVTIESLRSQIGLVLQDNLLFSGTVMNNIRYGKPEATDEDVIEAAKKVGAHEYILDLPQGYQSEVREFGNLLSVGQKQLVAFARALLIDPPILILDEATSAVDPYSELIIQQALETLLSDRTSISIAHRLSTIINSDRIVVLKKGKIIEEGNHENLMEREDGVYKHLFNMQFKDPFKK